uniref:Protein mesh-like n=1 Tax=Crassostrea virginica TaxID=6565 RepID=A0A8B8D7X5_CRAVI|nr:protein mesh-like [Crassostrea virginica]
MQDLYFVFYFVAVLGVKLDDFYPYGSQNGDTAMSKNDDGSSPDIPISSLFPFFNHQHSKLTVNTNGVISFLQTVSTYTPDPFPIANDARMIAPFWADINTLRGGTVWYRETTDIKLLDRATDEVRAYFPKFLKFRASWLFVATWDHVAFFGCSNEGCSKTNTFQSVLITNGQHSFTIYNYEDIQWTTGTASRGNATTGLGGTPAQVGFNAGDGIVFYTVNASRTPDIVNVDEYSNVNIPGKFVFRIDASDISDGGCNTKGNLTISPRYGPMLGGQYVVISGPCIDNETEIKASFSGFPEQKCYRKSEFSVSCVTPIFNRTGDITVTIEIENNQGENSVFRGIYTILNPADSKHRVYRRNPEEWFPGRHQINWDIDAAELQEADTVDIHLFTFMEDASHQLKWKREIIDEGKQTSLGSTNVYVPRVGSAMAIRVTPSNKRRDESERGIWSDIFFLAEKTDVALSLCKDWLENEEKMPSLPFDDVQPCPCTVDQALLDVVRFQPDPDCNMFNNKNSSCFYRRNATHCIRLSKAGPNGIDNLCCYDVDNKLIDSRQAEGGFLQRYHYLGEDGTIPYLTNFYYDVIPYLHCCRYNKNSVQENDVNIEDVCYKFFEYRKRSSCVNYDPPRPARTSGDPHISTLDGYSYTFNGVGEFVYLKTIDESFQSHIRFEQFQKETGDLVDASVCTAFASRHFNSSGIIEVRLNSIRTADILIDGELLDFDESNSYQFPGVSVMQFTTNQPSKREFIVSFTEIGIAFKAEASPTVLNILPVVGNKSLAGRLRGLLGDFDSMPDNDLRTPSEEILLPNSTAERIYDEFGVLWRINERETLFTYEAGKSYQEYQLLAFRPEFLIPSNIPPEVEQLCGEDQECMFDFIQTGSAEFATETLQFSTVYNTSVEASFEIKVCENLPSVEGGVWKAADTLEGSNATLQCSHGYEMIGESTDIYCSNGSWSDFDNVRCALLAKEETTNITYSKETTTKALPANEETTNITYSKETTTIALPETSRVQSEESSGNQNLIIAGVVVLVLFVLVITGIVLFRFLRIRKKELDELPVVELKPSF